MSLCYCSFWPRIAGQENVCCCKVSRRMAATPNCGSNLSSLCMVLHRPSVYWLCRTCLTWLGASLHRQSHRQSHAHILLFLLDCGAWDLQSVTVAAGESERDSPGALYLPSVRVSARYALTLRFQIFPALSLPKVWPAHTIIFSLLSRESCKNRTPINALLHLSALFHS